jgi:hypothetical protein
MQMWKEAGKIRDQQINSLGQIRWAEKIRRQLLSLYSLSIEQSFSPQTRLAERA